MLAICEIQRSLSYLEMTDTTKICKQIQAHGQIVFENLMTQRKEMIVTDGTLNMRVEQCPGNGEGAVPMACQWGTFLHRYVGCADFIEGFV